jgi:hypothetical protein
MVENLIKRKFILGLNKKEVLELFGDEFNTSNKGHLVYVK